MPEPMREAFGPYVLVQVLGRGGMGVVYVARSDQHPGGFVALKRLRADRLGAEKLRERFLHECSLTLRLRHPNVVPALEAGEVDGVPFVASQLVRGQSCSAIGRRLAEGEAPSIGFVVRVLADVLSALAYIHEAKEPGAGSLQLVHRDVTPGNILVGYDGQVRLGDFGLAKSLLTADLKLTEEGTLVGTPRYMPPEVALGGQATPKSDLYSLGAVTYRLLALQGPYERDSNMDIFRALVAGPPPALREVRSDVPPWLAHLVDRMMTRDPVKRPSDARVLRDELFDRAETVGVRFEADRVGQWLSRMFQAELRKQEAFLEKARSVKVDPFGQGPSTRVLPPQDPFPSLELLSGDEGAPDGATYVEAGRHASGSRTAILRSPSHPPLDGVEAGATAEASMQSRDLPEQATAMERPAPQRGPETGSMSGRPGPVVVRAYEPPPPPPTQPSPSADLHPNRGSADVVVQQARARDPSQVPLWVVLGLLVVASLLGAVVTLFAVDRGPDPATYRLVEQLVVVEQAVREYEQKNGPLPDLTQKLRESRRLLLEGGDTVKAALLLQEARTGLEARSGTRIRLPPAE